MWKINVWQTRFFQLFKYMENLKTWCLFHGLSADLGQILICCIECFCNTIADAIYYVGNLSKIINGFVRMIKQRVLADVMLTLANMRKKAAILGPRILHPAQPRLDKLNRFCYATAVGQHSNMWKISQFLRIISKHNFLLLFTLMQ